MLAYEFFPFEKVLLLRGIEICNKVFIYYFSSLFSFAKLFCE